MPVSQERLESILQDKFPDAKIKIIDLVGDQDHYSITIYSNYFENLSVLQRHKLVKQALGDLLKTELHAVTIMPKIPEKI
jgi:stress-induced morphogen